MLALPHTQFRRLASPIGLTRHRTQSVLLRKGSFRLLGLRRLVIGRLGSNRLRHLADPETCQQPLVGQGLMLFLSTRRAPAH